MSEMSTHQKNGLLYLAGVLNQIVHRFQCVVIMLALLVDLDCFLKFFTIFSAVVEVCTTFLEVFTMLCAMLDGSITAHVRLPYRLQTGTGR